MLVANVINRINYQFKDVQRSRQIKNRPEEHTGKAEAVQTACFVEKTTMRREKSFERQNADRVKRALYYPLTSV